MSEPLPAGAPGDGEALERDRRRRKRVITACLTLLGVACGMAIGTWAADKSMALGQPWPPALAAGFAIAYIVAVIAGHIALWRHQDEVELAAQYKAAAAGAAAYILLYPVWFLLWKGGFLPEPMHAALFFGILVVMALASFFYRFR